MDSRLRVAFTKLENDTEKLLKAVSAAEKERLHHSIGGAWSVNQILNHLLASERLSLLYMKKKSLGIDDLGDSGWLEKLKFGLLKISQRLPLRYKAPGIVVKHTTELNNLEDVRREWQTLRADLHQFLEGIQEQHVRRKIYKHPVAGRLDAVQAVGFLREHLRHHLPQIMRHL